VVYQLNFHQGGEVIMWEVVTSHGHRARDIRHESDAQETVYSLGITTLIAPGRYLVADNRGDQFVAEIHP
jgi:hypothetical protein